MNVRRLFIFLEHSIDKSTQWAVFEPNNERLWANIRFTIEDFLFLQWKSGALLGSKPEEAYFVRCDRTTMTQNDLDNGRLHLPDRRRADEAGRVRDLPDRSVDRRLEAELRRQPWQFFAKRPRTGHSTSSSPSAATRARATRGRSSAASRTSAGSASTSATRSTATATSASNTARKVPNTHKLDDVTLKRGLVGSLDLFTWLKGVRDGTADPRDITITLLDEARQPVADVAAAPRAAEEVGRPDAGGQGRRRGGDGGAPPRPRGNRVQLSSLLVHGVQIGAPGVYLAPPAPARQLLGVRMDVCAFVGVAPRGPARVPYTDEELASRRRSAPVVAGALLERTPVVARTPAAPVRRGPGRELGRVRPPVRPLRRARSAALRGRLVLRAGRPPRVRRAHRPRVPGARVAADELGLGRRPVTWLRGRRREAAPAHPGAERGNVGQRAHAAAVLRGATAAPGAGRSRPAWSSRRAALRRRGHCCA